MSSDEQKFKLRLYFANDESSELIRTEFGSGTTLPAAHMEEAGARLNAFCLFFVRACLDAKVNRGEKDFVQCDEDDKYIRTFANSLENKELVVTNPFESETKTLSRIFQTKHGDNRSGKNPELPRKVRMRWQCLPTKNICIVLGNNETPTKEQLIKLANCLEREWRLRSGYKTAQETTTHREAVMADAERLSRKCVTIPRRIYAPLNARLAKGDGTKAKQPQSAALLKLIGDRIIIHDAILDGAIAGFDGVTPERLNVIMTTTDPKLPQYVLDKKRSLPEPKPNKPKAFLARWTPPIIDRGAILDLTLGSTDFWTNMAVEKCMPRVHKDILKGKLPIFTFPRRLDVPVVVITADQQLVLCKRGDRDVVRYYPLHWEVSIGESLDAKKDLEESGQIHPACTVRRALREELGIPKRIANDVPMIFVAIGTEWPVLLVNLVAVTRFATAEAGNVSEWWNGRKDHEHTDLDFKDFTLDSGISLVIPGTHQKLGEPDTNAPLHPMARLAMLSALCNEFGYDNVVARI